ncbi:MAG: AMP-binding protein [Rhizobiaceae bacterium]
MNPALWLQRSGHLFANSPALFSGTRQTATYQEFAERAAALAGAFRNQFGIEEGDRIAIFMPNSSAYLELLYGAWHAGAAVVPINVKLHPREAAWIATNAGAKLVVACEKTAAALREAIGEGGCRIIEIESEAFRQLYQSPPMPQPVHRRPDDLAWLFYTSGTTGRPKGVMITNANIMAMVQGYLADVDEVHASDTKVYAAPMSHGAGLYNFMFVIKGARHVVPDSAGFEASELIELAGTMGNVCLFAAPTMVRRLVSEAKAVGYDGSGIRTIVYGGGPMYVADIVEAVDVMGSRFAQIYGQGESPMTITCLPKAFVADRAHARWKNRLASVGFPFSSTEVRIVDANNRELASGEVGEVAVRGSSVMSGYWMNPEASAETIVDGWLRTGDMGAMDNDGFLTLHDRSKDTIISGGTNIYPREVEEVLLAHPSVAQVSVVGEADAEWGENVVAFVVLESGATCDDAMLDAHCIDNIARFKRPKRYVYVDDLPKNAYGKVLKTALRESLRERDTR